ncbi:DUF2690 domain-containing protein [Streptomyces sp. NPDC004539]|uniref:helix-turn-helix domain-containing protein n=1 Tax=Streptomyces sp. NPDC004539 TaxID=3154280 RepID=UPI0033A22C2A
MTGTPPECERLAAHLRTLRDRHRLTLSTLAAESSYSRSSWQRWLTGRSVPPWAAVQSLSRLTGEPEPQARALWELAETAWSRRTATCTVPAAANTPEREHSTPENSPTAPTPVRRNRITAGIAAFTTALALSATALLTGATQSHSHDSPASPVGCTGTACNGKDPGPVLCGLTPKTLLHTQTPTGIGLEIRYNPLCRAAWARVWNAPAGTTLTFTVPGQPTQHVTVTHAPDTDPFIYTGLAALLGPGPDISACVTPPSKTPATCYTAHRP